MCQWEVKWVKAWNELRAGMLAMTDNNVAEALGNDYAFLNED